MFIAQGINNGRSGERNGFSPTPKKVSSVRSSPSIPTFFAFLGFDLSSPTFLSGLRIGRWLQKWTGNGSGGLYGYGKIVFSQCLASQLAKKSDCMKLPFFFRHTQALPSIYGVFPPPLISLPPPYFLCPLSVKIGSKLIMGLFCGLEIFFILLRGNSRVGSSFLTHPTAHNKMMKPPFSDQNV